MSEEMMIQRLIENLEHKEDIMRSSACAALGKMGEGVVAPLIKLLQTHKSWHVRFNAARALAEIKSKKTVPQLIDALLLEKSSNVKEWLFIGLGRIGDTRAVTPLIELLNDTDPSLKYYVVSALGRIGDSSAILALIKVFEDETGVVRLGAAEALVKIGDKIGIGKILDAVKEYAPTKKGKNNFVDGYTKLIGELRNLKMRLNKGKLSEGKPKHPDGRKGRLVRVRRASVQ